MFNKTKTQTFQVAEIMLEDNETFDEAAKDVELPLEQRETLKRMAVRSKMSIKNYMVHLSFYDHPIIGPVLRWWLEKTFAEQVVSTVLYLIVLTMFFGSLIIHDYSAKEKYKGFGHMVEERRGK